MHNILNLWAIEDGILIGVDLQFTAMFRLSCPDVLFAGEGEAGQYATCLRRLLDCLPPNVTAQLVIQCRRRDDAVIDRFEGLDRPQEPLVGYITRQRAAFLRGISAKRVTHYLALTTYPEADDLSKLRVKPLGVCLPDPGRRLCSLHGERVVGLRKVAAAALAALREAKIEAKPLSPQEIIAFLHEKLNPATARTTPPPPMQPGVTLRSQIALNACEAGFAHAFLDGYYHRGVNLLLRPSTLDHRALAHLVDAVAPDFDLAVCVHSLDQARARKEIQWLETSAAVMGQLNLFSAYHEAALRAEDARALLADTAADFQRLYLASCAFVLRDTDTRQLTLSADSAIQALRRVDDAVGIVDDMNHLHLLLSTIPGHSHLNARNHVINTAAAARLLTMSASWDGHGHPEAVFPADDGKLVPVDFFSDEVTAKHGLILGVTGEGKSVLTNAILTSFYCADQANNVIVIDNGESYKRLCNIFQGQYLEPDLAGDYAFNPFLPRQYAFQENGEGLDADFLAFVTTMVQLMVRKADLTNNEKSIIQKCVLAAYSAADHPLLGDLRRAFSLFKGDAEDTAIARGFYKNLGLWTEGLYGRLLNRPSNFDATARFIVFNLDKLTAPDLAPVVFLIIKSVIHPKLADRRLRKMIALDEVWKWLREKEGAQLAEEWYKTGRKYGAAVTVVTQSPEDLLASAAAPAIIQNSTIKYVLNLGGGYENLSKYKFTEEEIAAIRNLGRNPERKKYRLVFLKFGDRQRVIRNWISPIEYWLYTTDAEDWKKEAALRQRHPDWSVMQLIEELARAQEAKP